MITGALLTGNYGMWNAYALVMMVLYAPDSAAAKGMCVANSYVHEHTEQLLCSYMNQLNKV